MSTEHDDVEAITWEILAGRAGQRKTPGTIGELHIIVAEILARSHAAESGAVPVTCGDLTPENAARFAAFIERLKQDGVLDTGWRKDSLQDAPFEITDTGKRALQGGPLPTREHSTTAANEKRNPPASSGKHDRRRILESILKLQGSGGSYVDSTVIASDVGLDLEDVQGHLHLLEEQGRIQLAASFEGCSAFLSPPQRQRVLERQRKLSERQRVPERQREPPRTASGVPKVNNRKVFVVHGRNTAARNALFTFLRALGLHPLEWSEVVKETGKGSPYIGEVLETGFLIAQAVVVLLTPDDEAQLREPYRRPDDPAYELALTPQARPNVIFEAGMALGLFKDRTILIELGQLRPISATVGRHVTRMDDSPENRQNFAERLETAGCAVNRTGTDWYSAGDFAAAAPILERAARQSIVPANAPTHQAAISEASGRKSATGLLCRCGKPTVTVGSERRCNNHQCVESHRHTHAKCPECGEHAATVVRTSMLDADYLCPNGHPFNMPNRPDQ
jgi:hypothetical protein